MRIGAYRLMLFADMLVEPPEALQLRLLALIVALVAKERVEKAMARVRRRPVVIANNGLQQSILFSLLPRSFDGLLCALKALQHINGILRVMRGLRLCTVSARHPHRDMGTYRNLLGVQLRRDD